MSAAPDTTAMHIKALEGLYEFAGTATAAALDAAIAAIAGQADAVAWQWRNEDGDWIETSCPNVWRDHGHEVRALYTSPPAAIPVDALRQAFLAGWDRCHDRYFVSVSDVEKDWKEYASSDELTAIIAPPSIGAEAQEGAK